MYWTNRKCTYGPNDPHINGTMYRSYCAGTTVDNFPTRNLTFPFSTSPLPSLSPSPSPSRRGNGVSNWFERVLHTYLRGYWGFNSDTAACVGTKHRKHPIVHGSISSKSKGWIESFYHYLLYMLCSACFMPHRRCAQLSAAKLTH